MKKKGYFVKKIFLGFLFLNILTRFGFFINTMIDSFSGGNILGEEVLMIVSIISPLFYLISFFASMIGPGCGVLYAMFVGKFEKEKADRFAGFSLLGSILLGFICALLLIIIKKPFLSFYNIDNSLYGGASSYYNWYIGLSLVLPIYYSIFYVTLSDGDALFTMISTVGGIIVNAVLSIVLCKSMGIDGLGLSTFLSYVFALAVNCLHFVSKKNSIKFKLCLKFSMFKKAILFSINSALNNVFIVAVHLIVNKAIIHSCGSYYLPVYASIDFVISVFGIISAVGDSTKGLCSSYYGEENTQGVKNTIKLSYKVIAIMGSIITGFLLLCSPFVYRLFGITSGNLIECVQRATMILSVSAIPMGIMYFCYQIYSTINRPLISLLSTFLFNFVCPLILIIPLTYSIGIDGVAIGMCISPFLALGVFYLSLLLKFKKSGFPLYLKDTKEISYTYDFVLSNNTIVEIRNIITEILKKENYEIKRIDLLFEEFFLKIYEKNNYKKIICECSIFVGENHVRIITRDNGMVFNFVEQDNQSRSLNAILLNNLLTYVNEKDYLLTVSVNRNAFIFRK